MGKYLLKGQYQANVYMKLKAKMQQQFHVKQIKF